MQQVIKSEHTPLHSALCHVDAMKLLNYDNDITRHSFPFPYDGLGTNERNNFLDLSMSQEQLKQEDNPSHDDDNIDIEHHNWMQTNDQSEDCRHVKFIPNPNLVHH